ncbi:MAG: helix-turn-helix transcriptional regulator [Hyphomicrobiales bacterium]|nr:helix-turn-helix transcriptional regulator [Amphiplicatus sp.]MCC2103956.1 helix-turn-helix transcriptional regulator [Hyphomicrobiales bacterium]MCC2108194.1 helix-turn-helix transcriptional regulator [Hyphomicrobiales bacterium]MCC2111735.1 helix-turn-helix transcriptional regulator [Hyphomicrobiales bacterium]
MSAKDLSLLEQRIMLAILRQHPNAYGVSIQDEIRTRSGKDYSFGSIYTALGRLEDNGFIESRAGEASATRGGRRKLYFELTGMGSRVLDQELNATDALRVGVPGEVADVRSF